MSTPDPAPTTLVILGASGDLTRRLLLPGLGSLLAAEPDREVTLIGADRRAIPDEEWRERVGEALREGGAPANIAVDVAEASRYITVDLLDAIQLTDLLEQTEGPTVFYFALAPSISARVCEMLARIGLPDRFRLALEKPFGTDGPSARALNEQLAEFIDEERVFRVDHFLGTSPVLGLLQLRFANRILHELWNAEHVADVEIVFDEVLTLEGRAAYYDDAGALRDMLQSHLLLVLAVVAMERPADLGPDGIRDAMLEVLQSTRSWGSDPAASSHRARYTAGTVGTRAVPDYLAEDGVDRDKGTETLAAATFAIDTPRWDGVPFTIRSGKAMRADRYEAVVTFRPVDGLPDGLRGTELTDLTNQLSLDLGPMLLGLRLVTNDSAWRDLNSTFLRGGGPGTRLWPYGQVLQCVLDGDRALSVSAEITEELWRICDPILEAWREGRTPMESYPAGSSGPEAWSTHPSLSRAGAPLDTSFVPDPDEVARQRRALAYDPEYRTSAQEW